MKGLSKVLWIGVILSSLLGVLIVFGAITITQTVMQESAGIALGISFAVIPYCIARAVSEIGKG